jgi:lincosamide nucleotidyltransferase A/C/D/E
MGGGRAVDALVGEQTRPHADLDLWVSAADTERVFTALVGQGMGHILTGSRGSPSRPVRHS